jgi:hypothetical protein
MIFHVLMCSCREACNFRSTATCVRHHHSKPLSFKSLHQNYYSFCIVYVYIMQLQANNGFVNMKFTSEMCCSHINAAYIEYNCRNTCKCFQCKNWGTYKRQFKAQLIKACKHLFNIECLEEACPPYCCEGNYCKICSACDQHEI